MEQKTSAPLPIEALQDAIGYTYNNIELLRTAMTHSSYCNETKHGKQRLQDNERLEFLGDSVLSVLVSDYIFNCYGELNEGELTKTRAASVCEDSLFMLAIDLNLGDYMLFGHGESTSRGRLRKSILADAFEALLASIYLDGGLECAREFLLSKIVPIIDKAAKGWDTDYKSRLQKLVQQTPEEVLEYKLIEELGPPHDRIFKTAVYLNSNVLGEGCGRTKREAEQQAAKIALGFFGEE
ncbi:MAG: ribonuclease III [Clostridia bacterium]|nr:ribonuclease III [Clostridia bacterium]